MCRDLGEANGDELVLACLEPGFDYAGLEVTLTDTAPMSVTTSTSTPATSVPATTAAAAASAAPRFTG
jgi:hypothetical protein